jgi:thiol-disulfide isomerase/thioredoxin
MDRLLILVAVLAVLGLVWLVWRGAKYSMRRSIQVDKDSFRGDRPTLLYFYTDDCAPCRLQQGPILASLQEMMGDVVRFQEYDALAHPDVASQYRVLTVPTTVVVAPNGAVVAVNYGVTQSGKLRRQLEDASAGHRTLFRKVKHIICLVADEADGLGGTKPGTQPTGRTVVVDHDIGDGQAGCGYSRRWIRR